MPLTDSHVEHLKSICAEWDKAEEDIKLAELVCSDVVNPAIKELRYAGRRIVDAIQCMDSGGTDEDIQGFLNDAKFDCYRARHDAIDVATAKMAKDIEIMVRKIKYDAILKSYPKFPELYGSLNVLRTKIARSRKQRQNREAIYSSIENVDMPELVELFQNLRGCEPMMIDLEKSDRREKLVNRVLTVLSLLIAAAAIKDDVAQWAHKIFG
ncbi:MAG: hypothetical protein N2444_07180 [Methylocystis sp.]|nr:hypothetical protein [Methylocystis sp.]